MNKKRTKFENYTNAIKRLKEGASKIDEDNDLLRDGLIQRFEFTFELAWKTLKFLFEDEGLMGLNSPKAVLREAFSAGLIEGEDLWITMLRDRNSTSHIYNENISKEICNKIIEKYAFELDKLREKIKARYFPIL